MAVDKKRFDNSVENAWCPGCGNFGIQNAIKAALSEMDLRPQDVLMVSGIGQAAKMPHYINAHGLNGLHGRALPMAFGARVADPNLKIMISTGDGDGFGEGGNHFIHAIRKNIDVVHMVHDNQVYGLTKGQASPTTDLGQTTTLQTRGVRVEPLNPMAMAVSLDCSFVARAFSGDQAHLKEILKAAIAHEGYAFVDILQPCVSFNKVNTYKWYKDHIYYLDDDYDPTNREQAFKTALQWGEDGIPVGILYKSPRDTYMKRIKHLKGVEPFAALNRSPENMKNVLDAYRIQ